MIRSTTGPAVATRDRPANTLAATITGRDYVSHSQLSLMRACPRKFAYTYVEQAQPEFIPSSLKFGSAVHRAIEAFFQARLEGRRLTRDAMREVYREAWAQREDREAGLPVRFNKTETEEGLHELADRMLDAFMASPLAAFAGDVIAIEESMRATLHHDLPDILARVDVVMLDEAGLHVIDFKTSRSRWTPEKAAESGDQLMLYHRMARPIQNELGVKMHLHFGVITKAKAPAVQMLDVPPSTQRIRDVIEGFRGVWAAVQAGNFYANPQPMNCSTCPFKNRCPAFKGA